MLLVLKDAIKESQSGCDCMLVGKIEDREFELEKFIGGQESGD